MSFSVEKWVENAIDGEILFSFIGDFSAENVTNLLDDAEVKLVEFDVPKKIKKRIYNSLVEGFQNLHHHSMTNILNGMVEGQRFGIALLFKSDENYKFIHGNFVNNGNVQMLKSRLDQINALSKDELKILYKMILNNEEFSTKGGGGLGMIDIARKTGSNLDYDFIEINEKFSFYSFSVLI